MKCPRCGHEIGTAIVALADHAYLLRTQCEKCGKEFLIVDGIPMTEEQYRSHNLRDR
jgi:ribosomal protein S27AE